LNNKEKNILFIANQEFNCAPNQRFRFEQYLNYLENNGFQYKISHLLSSKEAKLLYRKGNYLSKALIIIRSYLKRTIDLQRIKNYSVVYISREALMTGSFFFEKALKRKGIRFIYDFDDAIWNLDVSPANAKFSWLKNPAKTSKIISLAEIVVAGNSYLNDYAKKFNNNVVIIPTTIDTSKFIPSRRNTNSDIITIGWSGSNTTIAHFKTIIPVLIKIKEKYNNVKFKVIGDDNYFCKELNIKGIAWQSYNEVEELSEFDIGIMPLPDNEWAKGKCGLKGLSFMALEIPTIMSPVGVNTEIINNGVNGFLASTEEEWIEVLSQLIDSLELRLKIGKEGRKTVVEKYSVEANKDKYIKAFNSVL